MIIEVLKAVKGGKDPWLFDLSVITTIKCDSKAKKVLGQHFSGSWLVLSDDVKDWGSIRREWILSHDGAEVIQLGTENQAPDDG